MINKCTFFKYRSKKQIRYLYCTTTKKEIKYDDCKNCNHKEYKKTKPMKQRSSKLAKAEKNRYSAFTDNLKVCIECGKENNHLHEIYYGKNRQNSIHYGFVIPLCHKCHRKIHNSSEMSLKWKIKGQVLWEQKNTKDSFIEIFGQNYISNR